MTSYTHGTKQPTRDNVSPSCVYPLLVFPTNQCHPAAKESRKSFESRGTGLLPWRWRRHRERCCSRALTSWRGPAEAEEPGRWNGKSRRRPSPLLSSWIFGFAAAALMEACDAGSGGDGRRVPG
jgi:hypothetical protein